MRTLKSQVADGISEPKPIKTPDLRISQNQQSRIVVLCSRDRMRSDSVQIMLTRIIFDLQDATAIKDASPKEVVCEPN